MRGITREWVSKAEGDYHSAEREFRARRKPNYDPAEVLEKYAVDIRYPSEFATKEEARAAIGAMKQARTFSKSALRP